jgi:transposase
MWCSKKATLQIASYWLSDDLRRVKRHPKTEYFRVFTQAVGQERTKEGFAKFFAMIGQQLCEKAEFVCSDMWNPHLDLIATHCPNALNILDRSHIVANMNKAIDEVRAEETRRMRHDGYEPVLRKSRWCLLKRQEDLTDKQRLRLRDLLQYNLRTVRAWLLNEEFQQL